MIARSPPSEEDEESVADGVVEEMSRVLLGNAGDEDEDEDEDDTVSERSSCMTVLRPCFCVG